jgi:hypothetical protein
MKIYKCPQGHKAIWHTKGWYCSDCDIYLPKRKRFDRFKKTSKTP